MRGRLADRVALVTGGSRGIGRAIVDLFRAEGAQVATCGRGARPPDLDRAVVWLTADVAAPGAAAALLKGMEAGPGTPDILVNNAGVQVEKPVTASTDGDWEAVMGVNARGVFALCREFVPAMASRGGGAVVNIGSISGLVADPAMALYNGSKAFVHGLTRSIAVDHGAEGIRCNAICPGWIMTGMADAAFAAAADPEAARADALARHSAGRFGMPADIAAAALFLASDEAAFVTGQTLVVDGGLTAASPLRPALF